MKHIFPYQHFINVVSMTTKENLDFGKKKKKQYLCLHLNFITHSCGLFTTFSLNYEARLFIQWIKGFHRLKSARINKEERSAGWGESGHTLIIGVSITLFVRCMILQKIKE